MAAYAPTLRGGTVVGTGAPALEPIAADIAARFGFVEKVRMEVGADADFALVEPGASFVLG